MHEQSMGKTNWKHKLGAQIIVVLMLMYMYKDQPAPY